MREYFKKYFYDDLRLSPHGENDLVFTAYFASMTMGTEDELPKDKINILIQNHINENGEYIQSDGKPKASLDTVTAIYCLSKLYNLDFHKKFVLGHHCKHPRDLFFFLHCSENIILKLIGNILFFISTICMIESVLNTTYKNIDGIKILETEGKLLTRLRINSFKLPITKIICDYIVKDKFEGYATFFHTYFKDVYHPNRILIRETE